MENWRLKEEGFPVPINPVPGIVSRTLPIRTHLTLIFYHVRTHLSSILQKRKLNNRKIKKLTQGFLAKKGQAKTHTGSALQHGAMLTTC